MASMQDPSFPLKLFVDKERNRVVVAEATGDFVDALFSFLTLPLGTIIRLVSKSQTHQPVEIGCINNLYQSVENFNTRAFWNQICKQMLLCPRNPCENLCQKLRFNVDDTEPTKYLMCGSCRGGSNLLLSTFEGVSCSCGKLMDKEMTLYEEDNSKGEAKGDGVFVRGETMYLIFDDLTVLQTSLGNTVQQLVQLGYRDFNKLTEMSPNVGLKEILDLLKRALISKSPLSDVFLAVKDGGSKPMCSLAPETASYGYCQLPIILKVTVSKSKNKILYAEAEGDFLDFLFSFLTMPLGSNLELLDGNVTLGSMDNLYKSVKGLSPSWLVSSSSSMLIRTPLLGLKTASQYGCKRQPLRLDEEEPPTYWHGNGAIRNSPCFMDNNEVISKNKYQISTPSAMKLFDPRSPDGRREPAVGFVRRPSLFAVTDDLQVTPLTSTSSISFLQKLNVPLDDLEEHVVTIVEREALNLLGASLTSKSALTNGLFYLLKKPKEEATAVNFCVPSDADSS